jgi:hypothetical protein
MIRLWKLVSVPTLALGLLSMIGCGSSAVSTRDVAEANAAVRGAYEAGAANDPKAALHLKMANDQIAAAQRALADDEEERADMLLERAEMDAELAVAMAHRATVARQAREAQARVIELQQSLGEQ